MLPRPTFLTSKGERCNQTYQYDAYSRYVNIAKGIYEWSGMPEGMPVGFIEEALFFYGCVGAKYSKALDEVVIVPAVPGLRTIYGTPIDWTPTAIQGYQAVPDITERSTNPTLYIGASISEQIDTYVEIQRQAYFSLRQNVLGLSQPIALSGPPGNNANGLMMKTDLSGGSMYIPVIDFAQIRAEVIDLKAKDYTNPLMATIDAMDAKILTVMGVNNTGTEKASGITTEETTALKQELYLSSDVGLAIRQMWCEKINPVLATDFSVRVSDAYKVMDEQPAENRPEEQEANSDE